TELAESIEEKLRELLGDDRARNEQALQKLQPVLQRYLLRAWPRPLLPDPATDIEDIVQDTWIRVFEYLDRGRISDIQHIRAWIHVVARHVLIDYARRAAAEGRGTGGRLERSTEDEEQSRALSSTVDPKATDPLKAASDQEEREMLWQTIETLPARDRALIKLRLWQHRTFSEIADVLAMHPAAVRQGDHRAICRLREILESKTPVSRDEK